MGTAMQASQARDDGSAPRERILAAARDVFLDGPPEQATMDAVAQKAGMSKKTIYREFKSQAGLLAALLVEDVTDLAAIPPPAAGDDIEQELYRLLVGLVAHFTSPRPMALARLIISEVRRYPELMNAGRPKGFPREILANWLACPAVSDAYQIDDTEDAAAMLIGMVMQDAGFRLLFVNTATLPLDVIEARARRAAHIFLRGVRRQP